MKIKQILVAFLFATLVISCGNKAKDINASELKTECEVTDALITVLDEMLELVEAVDSEEGASEEQKEEFKSLVEKAQEIEVQSDELGFKESDLEDCPSFETLEKKIKKTRKLGKVFGKAKDIDVSELKTECELVDAMITVVDEMSELAEAVDSEEGASEEQKKEYKLLVEKTVEIGEQSDELGFKESDFEDCPSFETFEKKFKKFEKIGKGMK